MLETYRTQTRKGEALASQPQFLVPRDIENEKLERKIPSGKQNHQKGTFSKSKTLGSLTGLVDQRWPQEETRNIPAMADVFTKL